MRNVYLTLLILASLTSVAQKKKITPTISRADSLFTAGNFKDAVTTYIAALKDPTAAKDVRAWYRLGASWFNLSDYSKALPPFEKAWTINSKQPGLRLGLARVYSQLNNNDKAIAMLDSTIANGFANEKFFDSDPSLENVRKDPRYAQVRERSMDVSYPCRKLPESKLFDFWIGDWDVSPTSNPSSITGFNRITKVAQGCIILENWQSVTGPHEGMSINYYDAIDKKWKQKWAGSGQDVQDFYDGEYVDNAMRFRFTGRNTDGTTFTGRLIFTNMAPGKVRQHSERTDDEGKTWQTIYDLMYIRRSEGAKP
ncbi:MAG: tetratricopeptide repeat protein [Bacteroidota bacterium]